MDPKKLENFKKFIDNLKLDIIKNHAEVGDQLNPHVLLIIDRNSEAYIQ